MSALLGLVGGLLGCAPEVATPAEPELRGVAQETACGTGPRRWTAQAVSDEDGLLRVPIELGEEESGFTVAADGFDEGTTAFPLGVIDPDGALVWGEDGLDWAALPWQQSPLRLRYGARGADGFDFGWPQLANEHVGPGTWELVLVTVDARTRLPLGQQAAAMKVSVGAPDDGDRCLPVVLGRSSGVPAWDDALEAALYAAGERWAAWGLRFDIEVLDEAEAPVNDMLTADGDPSLATLAARAPGRVPILALTADSGGSGALATTFGVPGQADADGHMGLRVDMSAFADEDGNVSDESSAHLVRVLTHEWGHWLGLPHTQQPDAFVFGSPIRVYDSFEDTAECEKYNPACAQAETDNLMWPLEDLTEPAPESLLSEEQLAAALQAASAY